MAVFLRDAARLRSANGGKMPPPADWPEPAVVRGESVRLPSADFARLWRRLPHEISLPEAAPAAPSGIVRLEYPEPDGADRLTVVVPPDGDRIAVLDTLYECARFGSAAVALTDPDGRATVADWKTALRTLLDDPRRAPLPVDLLLGGIDGQHAARAALELDDRRVRRLAGFHLEYRHPSPELSLAGAAGDGRRPRRLWFRSRFGLETAPPPGVEVQTVNAPSGELAWLKLPGLLAGRPMLKRHSAFENNN